MTHEQAILAIRARRVARPRRRHIPPALQPDGIRREYFVELKRLTDRMGELVRQHVGPVLERIAAPDDGTERPRVNPGPPLREALRNVAHQLGAEFPPARLAALARRIGGRTQVFQRAQWDRQLAAVFAPAPKIRHDEDAVVAAASGGWDGETPSTIAVNPLASEPWLHGKIAGFVQTNADLITNMHDRALLDIEQHVTEAALGGARHESLAKLVEARLGVSESRAKLIARDQVGKFYGALAQTRQQEAGVTSYTWRTVHDNRVREEHAALDGKKFAWAEGDAIEGHPGEAVNCRCEAEPDLDELLKFGEDEPAAEPEPEPLADPASVPAGSDYEPPDRPDPDRPVVPTPPEEMDENHRVTVERLRDAGVHTIVEDYAHPEVRQHIETLATLSPSAMRLLAGTSIHVADRGVSGFPAGRSLRGIMGPAGVSWDALPAAFLSDHHTIALGTGRVDETVSVGLHEVGHALAKSLGMERDMECAALIGRLFADGTVPRSFIQSYRDETTAAWEVLAEAIATSLYTTDREAVRRLYGDPLISYIEARVPHR